jgi:putative membrane protein
VRKLVWTWVINFVGIWAAAFIIPGIRYNDELGTLALVAVIFSLVNTFVRPIAVIMSCPLMVVTLGLFMLIVNALMFWLASWLAGQFGLGFQVDGFLNAFLGSLVVTAASVVANMLFGDREGRR